MKQGIVIFWRNHVVGGLIAGIGMLVLAYVAFVLGVVNNNTILQVIFAFPAFITSPLYEGVCKNQPDDCGFGILFLSIIVGWPFIGIVFGLIVGLIRKQRSHA